MLEKKEKVEFFISTKADLITKRVNDWIAKKEKEVGISFKINDISPFMSFSGERGYMIGCMVRYRELSLWEEENGNDQGTGASTV